MHVRPGGQLATDGIVRLQVVTGVIASPPLTGGASTPGGPGCEPHAIANSTKASLMQSPRATRLPAPFRALGAAPARRGSACGPFAALAGTSREMLGPVADLHWSWLA